MYTSRLGIVVLDEPHLVHVGTTLPIVPYRRCGFASKSMHNRVSVRLKRDGLPTVR